MRERNIYKDIVYCVVIGWILFFLYRQFQSFRKEQTIYEFSIQSDAELTQEMAEEFKKISGICRFEPVDTVKLTMKLGEYSMETELSGIELQEFSGKWKEVSETISLGNVPALFFGIGSFQKFADRQGYPPSKGQIERWIRDYQTLNLKIQDEAGHERNGRICGILEESEDQIFMDQMQMAEIFTEFVHTKGGQMEVYGYRNAKKARELLEQAGFTIGFDPD